MLPADKTKGARAKIVAALYLRYGVHTILYGNGLVALEGRAKSSTVYIDWLARILKIIETVSKYLQPFLDTNGASKSPTEYQPAELFENLRNALGTVDIDDESIDVLSCMFGHFRSGSETDPTARPMSFDDFCTLKEPEIRNCQFCGYDVGDKSEETKAHGSPRTIDSDEYTKFYRQLLSSILTTCLSNAPSVEPKRDLKARKLMLDGLYGGFLTGSLNAALASLRSEWHRWWSNWQGPPNHRRASFQRIEPSPDKSARQWCFQSHDDFSADLQHPIPIRFVRHNVTNTITDLNSFELPLSEPFPFTDGKLVENAKTHIKTFDTFIEAILSQWKADEFSMTAGSSHHGLRHFLLAASRGAGKGTFLSTISTIRGLELYIKAAWMAPLFDKASVRDQETNPKTPINVLIFVGSIFVNYSFSTEIASTFDSINDALEKCIIILQLANTDPENDPKGTDLDLYGLYRDFTNRTATFFSLDSKAAKQQKKLREKFQGLSRMEHFRRLLKMFATRSDTASNSVEGRTVVRQPRILLMLSAVDLLFNRRANPKNDEIQEFLGILADLEIRDVPIDLIVAGSENELGYPWGVIKNNQNKYEPAFCYKQIDRSDLPLRTQEQISIRAERGRLQVVDHHGKANRGPLPAFVHFARPVSAINLLIDNFDVLALALWLRSQKDATEEQRDKFHTALARLSRDLTNKFDQQWENKNLPTIDDLRDSFAFFADQLLQETFGPISRKDFRDILMKKYEEDKQHSRDWSTVRNFLGGNRFCLTIIMAATQHIVMKSADPIDGAGRAEDFIWATVDQVRHVGGRKREEIVLQSVLDHYRGRHEIASADDDFQLHQILLRHLAVIGSPVTAAVLVRLPAVREYFERLHQELPISRRRFIARALLTLCDRGLVFRLSPNPQLEEMGLKGSDDPENDRNWPAALEFRYALHRVIQQYGIARLGGGAADPIAANRFAPSLYASMSSTGPRLSREAYLFLRSLMVGLEQYPDIPSDEHLPEPWLFSTRFERVRVQALRAALSLVRSSFSVAVVSRFADYGRKLPGATTRGYLETYKVRLRWIVRMAWEQRKVDQKGGRERPATESSEDPERFHALYRDETVWLYNELGVTCFAQGNLSEALGFLRQAAEFNRSIERESIGASNFRHIDLNHTIVQLERGRLNSVRARLKRVIDSTKNGSDDPLYYLAKGYNCLVDHITGRREDLDERYREVVKFFQEIEDNRASAIFLNHYSRNRVDTSFDESMRLLKLARSLAETGGHEDVRHIVRLSEITLNQEAELSKRRTSSEALSELRDIESFGHRMGIWSIQCDALRMRGQLLLEQGETSTAGELLVRSLSIAKRNTMNLRLNRSMTVYSQILLKRGDSRGARRIANQSLELAKSIQYNLETIRAQKILSQIDQNPVFRTKQIEI